MISDSENPELAAYYADKGRMWRNVLFIQVANFGWTVAFAVLNPIMFLRLNERGLGEGGLGTITLINSWAASVLVMYFAWKSDHTVSRFGRRTPYLMISTPIIALCVALFPFFDSLPVLVAITIVKMLFMDMKAATFPLLNIDCVSRDVLARVNSITGIVLGLTSFFSLRFGMRYAETHETVCFLVGAAVMLVSTTITVLFIREPPIRVSQARPFRPWSTFSVAWKDRRNIILMLGVGTVNGMMVVYSNWIWLFAKNALGISRSETGDVLSWAGILGAIVIFPVAWAVDKVKSSVMIWIFYLMQVVLCGAFLQATNADGLMAIVLIVVFTAPCYQAADILVYKSAPREIIGSMTSTNSFLRHLVGGLVVLSSGGLIEMTGSYAMAFLLGIGVSTVGLVTLLIYLAKMNPSQPHPEPAPAAVAAT